MGGDADLSQWVLAGLGGEPYERRRSEEFSGQIVFVAKQLLGQGGEIEFDPQHRGE